MHELGSCNEGVDYVREKEILHRTSCTEAPQQNGIAGSKQKDFREHLARELFKQYSVHISQPHIMMLFNILDGRGYGERVSSNMC